MQTGGMRYRAGRSRRGPVGRTALPSPPGRELPRFLYMPKETGRGSPEALSCAVLSQIGLHARLHIVVDIYRAVYGVVMEESDNLSHSDNGVDGDAEVLPQFV